MGIISVFCTFLEAILLHCPICLTVVFLTLCRSYPGYTDFCLELCASFLFATLWMVHVPVCLQKCLLLTFIMLFLENERLDISKYNSFYLYLRLLAKNVLLPSACTALPGYHV